MQPLKDYFRYGFHCTYEKETSVKICTLEGKRKKPTRKEILKTPMLKYSGRNQDCSDLWVEVNIYDRGHTLFVPTRTIHKNFQIRWSWDEWLGFPISICDLTREAKLLITIFDYEGPLHRVPVGGTCISFFNEIALLRQGVFDLRVWPDVEGHHLNTPGEIELSDGEISEMQRLSKLVKQYNGELMLKVDWLDRLTFREIELIKDREKKKSDFMYLSIEFPKVTLDGENIEVIYRDPGYDNLVEAEKQVKKQRYYDPDLGFENLYEIKHHMLTRSAQSGITDKEQRPNSAIRDSLNKIMKYPPTRQLSIDEQDTVWKYRFYLSENKKALTKFLRCVNFELEEERKQAIDMLKCWAPLDAQDALELLGSNFTYSEIRQYAVERLSHATNEDLVLYLLQLVQALRYEPIDTNALNLLDDSHYSLESHASSDTGATVINDALSSIKEEDPSLEVGPPYSLTTPSESNVNTSTLEGSGNYQGLSVNMGKGLASLLIQRACENFTLANYLYWYLLVECEEKTDYLLNPESKVREKYEYVLGLFKIALQQTSLKSKATWRMLQRQQHFINNLVTIVTAVNKESGGRRKKIEKLQHLINTHDGHGTSMTCFEPLPLPLDPEVLVIGLIADEASIFKSALEPCRLTFITVCGSKYVTIFKHGDDLRQDQLIIQMIILMDTLLRNENLDLRLTPYRVLATSSRDGFVQYIESSSIAEIQRTDGGIHTFLRMHGGCENSPTGILTEVLDNYVKSLAGYCIITYILGVGDRHFDNLLLTKEGKLFHIDFGYILGRDPKPLPPPMKLTKEMIECIGGLSSEHYKEFRKLVHTTFHQLRPHANLILNLFSLMIDTDIPDIALEPDKATKKVEDRFCLSLSDEEIFSHIQDVIDQSLNAVVAVVVEQIHKFAQYIRQ